MAIAFVFASENVAQDGYDELMKAVGRESLDSPVPPGAIVHISGPSPTGSGWQVIDVWQDQASADAFYSSDQFAPVRERAEEAGIAITPWPIHRLESVQLVQVID